MGCRLCIRIQVRVKGHKKKLARNRILLRIAQLFLFSLLIAIGPSIFRLFLMGDFIRVHFQGRVFFSSQLFYRIQCNTENVVSYVNAL